MRNAYRCIKRVKDTILRYNMLSPGNRVVVGVSGGPDSICLLYILNDIKGEYNLSLYIAHLHHGFRSEEAEEDVRFVRKIGSSLEIPVYVEHIDIPAYLKKTGLSKQAGARKVRYNFFERIAEEIGADKIALGHTADDQIETFLMRLIRGAGSRGLSAIPPVRGKIIRPLIELFSEEIRQFLAERNIEYRIDSTNLLPLYLRNKIRLELIPYLEKEYNPAIRETLVRNIKILREEYFFLEQKTKELYHELLIEKTKESIQLDARRLKDLPLPLKRRVIHHGVATLRGKELTPLSFHHVEEIISLLTSNEGGEVHLPFGIIAEKAGPLFTLYFRRGKIVTPPYSYEVKIPGHTLIPEAALNLTITVISSDVLKDKEIYRNKDRVFLDMDALSFPLVVRNRRKGDFFFPFGMQGKRKKIKEYFIDLKIPRTMRGKIPLLTSPDGVLWVVGYRIDERFKVTEKTEKVLEVRVGKYEAF